MQEKNKILYKAVGNILRKLRKNSDKSYRIFCYENDIPVSTLDNLENARTSATFSNVYKVAEAYGLTFAQFAQLLAKELPSDFSMTDN